MDENRNPYLIPASIVVAGFLVAFAVLYTGGIGLGGARYAEEEGNVKGEQKLPGAESNIRRPDSNDRILGNPNAPVVIVEFSDLECPYCKQFHATMQQVMDTYGKEGKVAWVYRHFPIASIHSKAPKEAEAAECAYELGGNEKFWAYVNRVFEITPANNGLPVEELPRIATHVGLSSTAFQECLDSGKHALRVESDSQDAITSGAEGTPYSVVIAGDKFYPIGGALPFSQMKVIIDQALEGKP